MNAPEEEELRAGRGAGGREVSPELLQGPCTASADLLAPQERLLDLSKANPLLGINRSRVSRLRLVEPATEAVFQDLVVQERSIRMPRVVKVARASHTDEGGEGEAEPQYRVEPGDVTFDAAPVDLQRKLRRIYDNARAMDAGRAPLELSAYEAIGKAEKRRAEADVRGPLPWADLLAVTRVDLRAAVDALADLGAQADVFDRRPSHPWRGLAVEPGTPARCDVIESALAAIRTAIQALLGHLALLAPLFALTVSLTFDRLQTLTGVLAKLSKIERLPRGWSTREPQELDASAGLLEEAAARADEESSNVAEHERAWAVAPVEAVRLLEPSESEFGSPLRLFQPAYWRWRRGVREHLRPGTSSHFNSLRPNVYLL